jgi:hypothetical protein
VYTNKASLFQTAPKGVHHRQAPEQPSNSPQRSGRALEELDIEWAGDPLAAGQRAGGTLLRHRARPAGERPAPSASQQPRASQSLSRPSVSALMEPALHLRRVTSRRCASWSATELLNSIFSQVEVRTVAQDYTVRWGRGGVSDPASRSRRRDAWPASGDRAALGSHAVDAPEATASPARPLRGGKESQFDTLQTQPLLTVTQSLEPGDIRNIGPVRQLGTHNRLPQRVTPRHTIQH